MVLGVTHMHSSKRSFSIFLDVCFQAKTGVFRRHCSPIKTSLTNNASVYSLDSDFSRRNS